MGSGGEGNVDFSFEQQGEAGRVQQEMEVCGKNSFAQRDQIFSYREVKDAIGLCLEMKERSLSQNCKSRGLQWIAIN